MQCMFCVDMSPINQNIFCFVKDSELTALICIVTANKWEFLLLYILLSGLNVLNFSYSNDCTEVSHFHLIYLL